MYPFQRILVPTDFSLCAEAAYRQGLFLAQRYGAEVHFLHVAAPARSPGDSPAPEWPAWLAASNEASPDTERWRGVMLHRVRVEHPDPAAAILDYALAQQIDLIVMGAHGDRSESLFLCQVVDQAFLGRTAEQIVRHAPCPVAKVMMRGGGYPEMVNRLLVPYDGSSLASLALAYARDLAAHYDARLDLLHVIETGQHPAGGADEEAHLRTELIQAFEATRGPAITTGFHVVRGHPERAIRSFVRRHDVDLVVQGAHSDEGRDVLGVVAAEVARTVPCSVLTVREANNTATPSSWLDSSTMSSAA